MLFLEFGEIFLDIQNGKTTIARLEGESWSRLAGYAIVLVAVLIVIRIVWVYPAAYLPRLFSRTIREIQKAAEEGGFVVTCRDLPPLITQGEDRQDALVQAADAMDEVFATYMLEGIVFPTPSKTRRGEYSVAPPAETMAKAALYMAMSEAGITKVQLAKQMGIDEKEVRLSGGKDAEVLLFDMA